MFFLYLHFVQTIFLTHFDRRQCLEYPQSSLSSPKCLSGVLHNLDGEMCPFVSRLSVQEWRHAFGMRCLKIPNTAHFKEITKIEVRWDPQ